MFTQYIFCQLLTDPLVILPAPLRLTRLFILGISHFFEDLGVVFYKDLPREMPGIDRYARNQGFRFRE